METLNLEWCCGTLSSVLSQQSMMGGSNDLVKLLCRSKDVAVPSTLTPSAQRARSDQPKVPCSKLIGRHYHPENACRHAD